MSIIDESIKEKLEEAICSYEESIKKGNDFDVYRAYVLVKFYEDQIRLNSEY